MSFAPSACTPATGRGYKGGLGLELPVLRPSASRALDPAKETTSDDWLSLRCALPSAACVLHGMPALQSSNCASYQHADHDAFEQALLQQLSHQPQLLDVLVMDCVSCAKAEKAKEKVKAKERETRQVSQFIGMCSDLII